MTKDLSTIAITQDEIKALEEYQVNYYKIVNTLLRKGIISEQTINSKKGKDYVAPSNDELETAIENIKKIYSAIIKQTITNNGKNEQKPLYRGTQKSLIESIKENGEDTSFLSTTTSKNRTLTFSRTFSKNKNINSDEDKAILRVVGDVPHINLEDLILGGEDEILFAPAKAEIIDGIEGISDDDKRHREIYGDAYTLKLTKLDIPEMSNEDVDNLKKSIFSRNNRMRLIINEILRVQRFPSLFDSSNLDSLIEEYSQWKDDVISFCHQQFRIIEKDLERDYKKEGQINNIQTEAVVDTQKLGKETLNEQMDTKEKDNVEQEMVKQMEELNINKQNTTDKYENYQEHPETKNRVDENPESWKKSMRFEISPEQYKEMLSMHQQIEKNFEQEMMEHPEKKLNKLNMV